MRPSLKVLRATELGMCFGVSDALEVARCIADPDEVTIHGELVHNPEVLIDLRRRGFRQTPEGSRGPLPETDRVLITAHGISERERDRLIDSGKGLVDTTCPLVRFGHQSAYELARDGRFVVVVGRPGHVEVEGIVDDLADFAVVPDEVAVERWRASRIGVIAQSTTPPHHFAAVVATIERVNSGKDVRIIDTICGPTRNRQLAVLQLIPLVEALVVVGGRSSNNTRELAALAESRGVPAMRVESADDLDDEWLRRFAVIGLTAGTSTLPAAVDRVHEVLLRVSQGRLRRAG